VSFFTFSSERYVACVLLTAAVLFVGFVAGSHVIIDTLVAPVDQRLKKLRLQEANPRKDAAFGDSQLYAGFVASKDFVNLAFDGDSITDVAAKVDHFLEAGEPMRIVLQAAPQMFAGYRLTEVEQPFFQNYAQGVLSEYHRVRLLQYWAMLLSGADFAPRTQMQPNGWNKVLQDWSELPRQARLDQARGRVELHAPVEGFAHERDAQLYENLVARLTATGIDTCLVRVPLSLEYLTFSRQQPLFAAADRFFATVARRHGARYVDLSAALAGEEHAALFGDPDHLNAVGAPLATRMIREQCFPETLEATPGEGNPQRRHG
jgi:hypothetical protein